MAEYQRRSTDRMPEAGVDGAAGDAASDPTALTLARLLYEVGVLRGDFKDKLDALEELTEAKQRSVAREFELIEERRVEQKLDTKERVDAALAAQQALVKEQTEASQKAVEKSETSFSNALSQLRLEFGTAMAALTTSIEDIKERMNRIEARTVSIESRTSGGREAQVDMRAIIGLVLTAIIVAVGFYAARH